MTPRSVPVSPMTGETKANVLRRVTDFVASAFTIQWIYCKLVAFDTVRLVDKRHEGESVTQMWNGMQ